MLFQVIIKYRELLGTEDVLNIELMICKGCLLFVSSSNTEKRVECEQNGLCWSPVGEFVLCSAKKLRVFCSSNKNQLVNVCFIAFCLSFLFLDIFLPY